MAEHVEVDELFGEVTVVLDRDDGVVRVGGPAIPTATLCRTGPPRPEAYAPIGTRVAEDLVLDLAGEPVKIVPAPGRLTRRSYRVEAWRDGVEYRLVPSSSERSTLLRGDTRLGRLWAEPDAGVSAEWVAGSGVSPDDAALGYLLAAAFGTGAQHVLVSLISGAFNI